jgi:hypothetical protein
VVRDNNNEEWLNLCRLAAEENDPKKLKMLIAEITRLLGVKEQRLKANNSPAPQ